MALRHYNWRSTFLTLGPYRGGGWSGDGGITVSPGSDFAERVKSGDGLDTVLNYSNDYDAIVELVVHERATFYRDVMTLATAVRDAVANGTPVPVFPFGLEDTIGGDRMRGPEFGFLVLPNMDKGKSATDRTIRLVVPDGYRTAVFGTLN